MSRAPDQLAPSWLPRQQRRRIDQALRKLLRRDACSVCGKTFRHSSRTACGFDAHYDVAVTGECCIDRLTEIFLMGLYSERKYDFLLPGDSKPDNELTNEQVVAAIAAYQKIIIDTDKRLDDIERRGGTTRSRGVSLLDHPWKSDDRDWFERNRSRAHRVRMPFPGEADECGIKAPAGYSLIALVRQVEPGSQLKAWLCIIGDPSPPIPEVEALAHALFEIAVRREAAPFDLESFLALVGKYTALADGGTS